MAYIKALPETIAKLKQALALLLGPASSARRRRMQKRIDYYYDKQEEYLADLIHEQFLFPDRLKLQKEFLNVTKMVIDELAITYNEAPKRSIQEGTPMDDEILSEVAESSKLDFIMPQVNALTKLTKTILLKPTWRDDHIEIDVFTPNMFDILQDNLNPHKAEAVIWANIIDVNDERFQNNDDKAVNLDTFNADNTIFYYMDSTNFFMFTYRLNPDSSRTPQLIANEANIDNINPYGCLPFVVCRDSLPLGTFFVEGGDDLVNTNEVINVKLTELNHLIKMQSFSIPVRKGADNQSSTLILDPSLCIDLPLDDDLAKGSDFKFVTPDAKIPDVVNEIESKIKRLAVKYQLSPERFTVSAQKSSAESLQLRAWESGKILKKDKLAYADIEKHLFDVIRDVWNYHNPGKMISDQADLLVDYVEVETPMTVKEHDEHNLLLYTNKLLSRAGWLMAENPDIKTEEEAQTELEKIDASAPTVEVNLDNLLTMPDKSMMDQNADQQDQSTSS